MPLFWSYESKHSITEVGCPVGNPGLDVAGLTISTAQERCPASTAGWILINWAGSLGWNRGKGTRKGINVPSMSHLVRNEHEDRFVLWSIQEPKPWQPLLEEEAESSPVGLVALAQVSSAMSITRDVPWDSRGRNQATFKISTVWTVVLYYTALMSSEEGIPKHTG